MYSAPEVSINNAESDSDGSNCENEEVDDDDLTRIVPPEGGF